VAGCGNAVPHSRPSNGCNRPHHASWITHPRTLIRDFMGFVFPDWHWVKAEKTVLTHGPGIQD
jgi:hypothetical protein